MSLDLKPAEGQTPDTEDPKSRPVERQEERYADTNPVMNFFKTLVSVTYSKEMHVYSHISPHSNEYSSKYAFIP